jgi:hypothetical protein
MKGDPVKPAPFVLGLCFICNEPCHELSYCHQECSLAMADERSKRLEEARKLEEELNKKEKK